jgi:hypothetical protein
MKFTCLLRQNNFILNIRFILICVHLFCIVFLLHLADRGNVVIKVVMRKKNNCPNYREFRIREGRNSEVTLYLFLGNSL